MLLDLLVFGIVIISAIWYAHKGFSKSVRSTLEWVACIALGLFFCDDIARFLKDSPVGGSMRSGFEEKFSGVLGDSPAVSATPEIWRGWTESVMDDAAGAAADAVTGIVLSVLSFALLLFAIKVTLFITSRIFSKQYNDGVIGWVDGFAGGVLGVILGVIYVLIMMALLIPVMNWLAPEATEAVRNALDASFVSGCIYDNNPLLSLIGMVF